jgi:hypothetical protein
MHELKSFKSSIFRSLFLDAQILKKIIEIIINSKIFQQSELKNKKLMKNPRVLIFNTIRNKIIA